MKKRLLTWNDFYDYMNNRKKSMKFSADSTNEPIVVQVSGTLNFEESKDFTTGLTLVRLQACHTDKNFNSSSISYEVMRDKLLPTFKNRPILGYIHEVNGIPQFYGHNAHEVNGNIIYDEIAVGNIPETNNAELVYDEEKDRYNVMIDGYLYDEYTDATEIVEREGVCPCSVEISITSMEYDAKDKTLHINDGYFSGVTILGYDENGNKIQPGMENSNVKLKDFFMSNNSIFNDLSNDEHSKLIETLNNLNDTLSKMNFSSTQRDEHFEEGGNQKDNMTKFEELLSKYSKTVDDITFEYETLSDEELEKAFANAFEKTEPDDNTEENTEDNTTEEPEQVEESTDEPDDVTEDDTSEADGKDETDDSDNTEEPEDATDDKKSSFVKTFALSHDDIRSALYKLLRPIEEALHDCFWIASVYDDAFIYQDFGGHYFRQYYSKENDVVKFEGERQEVFADFLTIEEKKTLDEIRASYPSIKDELSQYKEAESLADKMTVFSDEAYKNYLETQEFKSLMETENLKKFTKEELSEKADAALGKLVKVNKTFSMNFEKTKENKPSFIAFAKHESNSSFLDGLLNK